MREFIQSRSVFLYSRKMISAVQLRKVFKPRDEIEKMSRGNDHDGINKRAAVLLTAYLQRRYGTRRIQRSSKQSCVIFFKQCWRLQRIKY